MGTEDTQQDTEIGPGEAAERIGAGAQLIDVRQDFEWQAGRIPGARHIPLEQLPAEAGSLDRSRPIVFSCRTGQRSGMATEVFRASGFDAYNLAGGLVAWVEAGLDIEPADGTVAGSTPDAS